MSSPSFKARNPHPRRHSTAQESRTYTLVEAAREGNIAMVQLLVQAGADVNGIFPSDTSNSSEPAGTALHAAVGFEQVGIIRALLNCGADAEMKDLWGRTPLEMALEKARHQQRYPGRVITTLSNHSIMKVLKRSDW